MNNTVSLTVNGRNYSGWKNVVISEGIERQCRSFQLATTWRWPGQTIELPIRFGDNVQIRIGDDLVVTGWVDATPVSVTGNSVTRSVSGRSLTCDLVDCSAEFSQWRGQSVASIVTALASTYGISVVDEAGSASTITDHSVDPGESVFESIDRLLSLSRLLSTDNGRGQLVIASPGSAGRAVDELVLGQNILASSMSQDFSRCFSEYRCLGQRSGSDTVDAVASAEVSASQLDSRVKRQRVLIIQQSGQLTPELAQERVQWERENRISRALTANVTVQGWRQSNGTLWQPNQIVRMRDDVCGIDRDMLIIEISYELSESGLLTHMRLAPPEGFGTQPTTITSTNKGKDSFEYLIPEDWDKK
mgnify:CR=1|nr:MAG TPA: 43 kDa tail protein [Caudoviricetes sp.]